MKYNQKANIEIDISKCKKDLKLYQQAGKNVLDTWIESELFNEIRVKIGMIEEGGEVFGVIKKTIRGDEGITDKHLKKEFGDLFYYLRVFYYYNENYIELESTKMFKVIQKEAQNIKKDFNTGIETKFEYLRRLLNLLTSKYFKFEYVVYYYFLNIYIFGFDFKEILELNRDKLQKRKKQGKIKGSGSNREEE